MFSPYPRLKKFMTESLIIQEEGGFSISLLTGQTSILVFLEEIFNQNKSMLSTLTSAMEATLTEVDKNIKKNCQ